MAPMELEPDDEESQWLRELITYNREATWLEPSTPCPCQAALTSPSTSASPQDRCLRSLCLRFCKEVHLWKTTSACLDHLEESLLKLGRTQECFAKIAADPCLECRLPKKGCRSGHVLAHAISIVEATLRKHAPAVFKIGYTHDPHFRFRNKKYGYVCDSQQWQSMIVLYASCECIGPSFLESALIQRFKGALDCP